MTAPPETPRAAVIAQLQAFRIALALVGGDLSEVPAVMHPPEPSALSEQGRTAA